jgi:TonB family protein
MYVGELPFTGDSPVAVLLKHVNEPLPVPSDTLISRPLVEAIRKAVAKDPAERWPSTGAFVSALEAALGMTPASAEADESGRARHVIRSRLGRATAATGALLAAAGLTWWIAREPTLRVPSPPSLASEQPIEAAPPVTRTPVARERIDRTPGPGTPASERPRSRGARAVPAAQPQAPPPLTEITPPQVAASIDVPSPQASPVQPPISPVDSSAAADRTPGTSPSQAIVDDIVTPPRRMRTVNPDYPAAARAAQLEGDVLLQALVGPDGKVRDVTVLRSVHPLIDEAAKKAVLRYEYAAGLRNGTPESVTIRITVSFRLR